tara:strand:+ start:64 stop:249 length:186 start_codon:yes stop_codon:yes gene_type:complete
MPDEASLIGKKIVGFKTRAYPDGFGGEAHDPLIYLDDGSVLTFITENTAEGETGVFVLRVS